MVQEARAKPARRTVKSERPGLPAGAFAFCGVRTALFVDPTRYRQGIGRQLLRHAINASGGSLSTEVLVGNDTALALYLSEGFKVERRVDGKLTGNEAFSAAGYVLQRTPSEAR